MDSIYPVTLKLTKSQFEWLDECRKQHLQVFDQDVTIQAIIVRLMELGAPQFITEQSRTSSKSKPKLKVISKHESK